MKTLLVKKITVKDIKVEDISAILDAEAVDYNLIDNANWADFTYTPEVKFRIAHNGDYILLNYKVNENDIKALCDKDNGEVCKDACVEFFVSFDKEAPLYYNIEVNCIGRVLMAARTERNNKERASNLILQHHVKRWSSLGNQPIVEDGVSGKWELSLLISKNAFFRSSIKDLSGLKCHANFYKCGDKLATPHYLSWNPIQSERPNFHLTEFFGVLIFE